MQYVCPKTLKLFNSIVGCYKEKINSLPHQGLILDLISISKDDLDDILEGNTDMNIHQLLSLIYKAGFLMY